MVNIVSLLPRLLNDRMERLMAESFTGSVEIHLQSGNIKGFKVVEQVKID